jgi:uncharacterized membrane protein
LFFAACFLPVAHALTIWGTVYDYTISPLPAVIYVNTTPQQQVVAANGSYSIVLSQPGVYNLTAVAASDPSEYYSQEIDASNSTGSFEVDFLLISDLGVNQSIQAIENYSVTTTTQAPPAAAATEATGPSPLGFAIVILALLVAGASAFWYWKSSKGPGVAFKQHPAPKAPPVRKAQPKEPEANAPAPFALVPLEDETRVMKALEEEGGITTQKDLRKRLSSWSEARVSLVLTSLEKLGKLTKIKRGRGNVIRKTKEGS